MAPSHQKGPDLKRYMDKKMRLSLNGNRKIVGVLRGYDAFLNVVLEETIEETSGGSGVESQIGTVVIRGSSIVQFESLERIVQE
mmetsp:Transcript_1754/g.2701  ORF Transcript_1754/g.2701 Transcript_1754/m.2701 type:complete len:84 (+) Transcript_1754:161-412(+)